MLDKVRELPADVANAAGKVMLAGLGAVSMAREESSRLFDMLVEKGRAYDSSRFGVGTLGTLKSAGDRAASTWTSVRDRVESGVDTVMHRVNLPTESEIAQLVGKVERLGAAVELLRAAREKALTAPPAAKKPEARPEAKPKAAKTTH